MKRITIPVEDQDAAFIEQVALTEERSVASVVRRIIRREREREDVEARA